MENRSWSLPETLGDVTKDAIAHAVDRGRMLLEGNHSICLTDAGRDLVTG
jgi:hypothetical protein